jgi:uncharacterized Zn finger protein
VVKNHSNTSEEQSWKKIMAKQMSLTWWGRDFIAALESITDTGRLQRGRSYSGDGRILDFEIAGEKVIATVRGNKNPYFGVYKEPRYQVQITLTPIPAKEWKLVIERLAENAGWLTRLLQGEVPSDIATAFNNAKVGLLPASGKELKARCSCPDYANPCKHIAGTYYRVAGLLDQDPFLLFQLRGMPHDKLQKALSATPLGRALAGQIASDVPLPEPQATVYPSITAQPVEASPDYPNFWRGSPLPKPRQHNGPRIPALAIRREGERPPFWHRENSFIEAMSELYLMVEKKNRGSL